MIPIIGTSAPNLSFNMKRPQPQEVSNHQELFCSQTSNNSQSVPLTQAPSLNPMGQNLNALYLLALMNQNNPSLTVPRPMNNISLLAHLYQQKMLERNLLGLAINSTINNQTPSPQLPVDEPSSSTLKAEDQLSEGIEFKSKKIKKVNQCGHPERPHYAKYMCNQCYLKYGRTKKPWLCKHEKLYAQGLCQNCYISAYNRKRNDKLKDKRSAKNSKSTADSSPRDESLNESSPSVDQSSSDKLQIE